MITLKTSMGDIVIELNHEAAPKTSENFEQYVRDGHYDGTIFHRVINNFMIQGGGFMPDMMQKATREPIENEANNGLSNEVGSIAMARTMAPHSASAQFFINVSNNKFLDYPGQDGWGYCVFGKVVEGMDVIDKIKVVATGNKAGHSDVPVEPIVIEKAEIGAPE
jgi:peptidyl-prolyl cis-trans isomerase B (cyclophilin B)